MRFRRRRTNDRHAGLAGEALALARALDRHSGEAFADPEALDLRAVVETVFDAPPTADVRALTARGTTAADFYDDELRPNWEGRSRGERSAKIRSFVRLANALGGEDAGGIGAVVRTKVALLAWAYDRVYSQRLLRQIVETPQRFGSLEAGASPAVRE